MLLYRITIVPSSCCCASDCCMVVVLDGRVIGDGGEGFWPGKGRTAKKGSKVEIIAGGAPRPRR